MTRRQVRGAATLSMTAREQVIRLAAFEQGIRGQCNAMTQRRQRDALDVIGRHEVASVDQRDDSAARTSASAPREPAPNASPGQSRVARTIRTA